MELGKVEGFWSMLRTATTSTNHIFECWAEILLATDTGENQSAVPCDNDVIRSDWVRPIGLHHLEFHARTLYMYVRFTMLKVYNSIMVLWLCITSWSGLRIEYLEWRAGLLVPEYTRSDLLSQTQDKAADQLCQCPKLQTCPLKNNVTITVTVK